MAVTAGDSPSPEHVTSSVAGAEIVGRAAAIAHGAHPHREPLDLPDELAAELDLVEGRAHTLACAGGGGEESCRAAALEFVASAVAALRLGRPIERGELRELVSEAAAAIGVSRGAANLLVFMRAVDATAVARLAPQNALSYVLDLLIELGPADGVSLWTSPGIGRVECLAASGDAAETRRLRAAARILLEDAEPTSAAAGSHVRAVAVTRWDLPHAALVGRARPEASGRLIAYLSEAAAALSPVFEREMLFEENASRERALASGCERWAARLSCDLHDGPLQELVAFADDLRLAREQVTSVIPGEEHRRVSGRFDDLQARLEGLDTSLRDLAQSARAAGALEGRLVTALRAEVDRFAWASGVRTAFSGRGESTALTSSQKIVFVRVLQEALANVRKHSGATRVDVTLRSTSRHVSLHVADDGTGFDVDGARRRGRLGLSGVIERVRLLGGDVQIRSEQGGGTRIVVTLPRWTPTERPASLAPYAAAR
jgi:signal transduction histidine kinase